MQMAPHIDMEQLPVENEAELRRNPSRDGPFGATEPSKNLPKFIGGTRFGLSL